MACCIFAAMIITNILVYWRRLKTFMGYAVSDNPGLVTAQDSPKPSKSMALRHRIRRAILPTFFIGATLSFGAMHWQHMLHELGTASPHFLSALTATEDSFLDEANEQRCN